MENIKCPECGNTADFDFWIEEEYNDGSNEPNTSNRLVSVEYYQCLKCSEIFTKKMKYMKIDYENEEERLKIEALLKEIKTILIKAYSHTTTEFYCNEKYDFSGLDEFAVQIFELFYPKECIREIVENIQLPKNKNYKDRYKRISQLDWFKKAYSGRSLGDIIEVND